MEPKKVWGVVLIVLGVFFVLGGIHRYSVANFYEKEISSLDKAMQSMDKEYLKTFGNSNANLFSAFYDKNENEKLFKNAKISCIFSVLLGIACSVFGTFLLKKTNTKIPIEPIVKKNFDELKLNLNVTEKNQTNSAEDKKKDDDTRWMPPEMRA